ncbi:MAG: hypothetical protein JWN72_2975 [Thermoleophilia bacterium]|nr:hypothetical protein [Thermoleophilia bacterium]
MSTPQHPAEIHVVAAPTEAFLLRVQLLAASIRRNAGDFATSRIVVTLSRDVEPWDIDSAFSWSRELGIEWRWVDAQTWADHDMFGSALKRFTYEVDAPYVIHLDADTLVTGPLDRLPSVTRDKFGGVVAHVAPAAFQVPFRDGRIHDGADYWAQLHEAAGLDAPQLTSEHTGWGLMDADPARRWCPPYYNLGMLAGERGVMQRVGAQVMQQMATVESRIDTHFRCQLAVALALAATDTPSTDLSMRYNFPNDERFAGRYREALLDVRVLHYLRDGEFERERDTASLSALDSFLARPITSAVDSQLQRTLRSLRSGLGDTKLPDAHYAPGHAPAIAALAAVAEVQGG